MAMKSKMNPGEFIALSACMMTLTALALTSCYQYSVSLGNILNSVRSPQQPRRSFRSFLWARLRRSFWRSFRSLWAPGNLTRWLPALHNWWSCSRLCTEFRSHASGTFCYRDGSVGGFDVHHRRRSRSLCR